MPKSRSIWIVLGTLAVAAVFVVGLLTVAHGLISDLHWPWASAGRVGQAQQLQGKTDEVTSIDNAKFSYLVPARDAQWQFDSSSTAYDQAKGIVKYLVTIKQGSVGVTISQQAMPADLRPRGSGKFAAFINNLKATRSQDAGSGKAYFLLALENGAPADGSDTVVYATDDILMFGRSGSILDYDVWAKLLASMQKAPHS